MRSRKHANPQAFARLLPCPAPSGQGLGFRVPTLHNLTWVLGGPRPSASLGRTAALPAACIATHECGAVPQPALRFPRARPSTGMGGPISRPADPRLLLPWGRLHHLRLRRWLGVRVGHAEERRAAQRGRLGLPARAREPAGKGAQAAAAPPAPCTCAAVMSPGLAAWSAHVSGCTRDGAVEHA